MSGLITAPRVRFAPSPTGYFHVGSARTALFNWLFARRHGGVFVLRIEDTDAARGSESWVGGIISAMDWLGMSPDEGPFRQSERVDRHQIAVEALWDGGFLYACNCTRADIDARTKGNATPGYDGHCRGRDLDRGPGRALRFRTPDQGETVIDDVIRGRVVFPHHAMEDFVCVKATGLPLFVLANTIDDRDMAISHVIRGEDLLPTSPKGVLLWRALDSTAGGQAGQGEVLPLPLPVFAHLPMLVNEQRKKLSKRRDPVAVEMYRDQGFLPQAFCNYLALLGWSPRGDAEKVPVETLINQFALGDVHHAPAYFDVAKLTHLNGEYLRELSTAEFIEACRPWVAPHSVDRGGWLPAAVPMIGSGVEPAVPTAAAIPTETRVPTLAETPTSASTETSVGTEPPAVAESPTVSYNPPWPPERFDAATFERLAPLVQERVPILSDVPPMVDFIFLADPVIDQAALAKAFADESAGDIVDAALKAYATCEWTAAALHQVTLEVAEAAGRKLGKAQAPIRVAVTGRAVGPPLFEALEVLGRTEVLRRLVAVRPAS